MWTVSCKSFEKCSRLGQYLLSRTLLELERRRNAVRYLARKASRAVAEDPKPSKAPIPPRAPQKLFEIKAHGKTWNDPYNWMSHMEDTIAMRHMEAHLIQEDRYAEEVMSDTVTLQTKLQSEMASRMANTLCTTPFRWGPWLYYKHAVEGKQYPVLCRRLASLNEEFSWTNRVTSGFDFKTGRNLEQILLDYNEVAQRFGGYACGDICEISPDHRYLAFSMYDKEKDLFTLSVKDLKTGSLLQKPRVDRVSSLAWAKDGCHLVYAVTNSDNRPYRVFLTSLESNEPDRLLMEEVDDSCYLAVRNTKDYAFISINYASHTSSKVYALNTADLKADIRKVWEGEPKVNCVLEHHHGQFFMFTDAPKYGKPVNSYYLLRTSVARCTPTDWKSVFIDDPDIILEDVEFFDKYLVLIIHYKRKFRVCCIDLPLPPINVGMLHPLNLRPCFLPLPNHVSNISTGPNHDFYSSTVRLLLSSPVMPEAVVDYDLSRKEWVIVEQEDVVGEKLKELYGSSYIQNNTKNNIDTSTSVHKFETGSEDSNRFWYDLSKFYVCEEHQVPSRDSTLVPLTIVYSRKGKRDGRSPCLLQGHGAYGELLDKGWNGDMKSLLDRDWIVAFADVRGGGGGGKKWHRDGRALKKKNGIEDFIACAQFLIDNGYVHNNKLAALGYSAGGLLVAAAINECPELFRAVVLKVPFLDVVSTLLDPILPITDTDYDEFGNPLNREEFESIKSYSPYENIQKGALYPAVLITSSLNGRFGVWEAAKWIGRVREYTSYDPSRPVLLHYTLNAVEENLYLRSKQTALEFAFLIKMVRASVDSDDN